MTRVDETTLFKMLDENGRGIYSGEPWSLPEGDKPGEWMPKVDRLEICRAGYHLARGEQVLDWLGPRMFVAEGRGASIERGNKVAFKQARLACELPWDGDVARLWAADVAESVLHLFEARFPDDARPRKAIEAARRGGANTATYATTATERAAAAAATAAHAAAATAAHATAATTTAATAAAATTAAAYAAYAASAEHQRAHTAFFHRLCQYLNGEVR